MKKKTGLLVKDVSKDHFSSGVSQKPPDFSRLIVTFLEGKRLLASDVETGKSDPVCFVWCGPSDETPNLAEAEDEMSGILKTKVCPTTTDPIWNEDIIFPLEFDDINALSQYKLMIYCRDEDINPDESISYDELGMVEVPFKDIITKGKTLKSGIVLSASWYTLQKSPGMRRVDGKIKLTINLVIDKGDFESVSNQLAINTGSMTVPNSNIVQQFQNLYKSHDSNHSNTDDYGSVLGSSNSLRSSGGFNGFGPRASSASPSRRRPGQGRNNNNIDDNASVISTSTTRSSRTGRSASAERMRNKSVAPLIRRHGKSVERPSTAPTISTIPEVINGRYSTIDDDEASHYQESVLPEHDHHQQQDDGEGNGEEEEDEVNMETISKNGPGFANKIQETKAARQNTPGTAATNGDIEQNVDESYVEDELLVIPNSTLTRDGGGGGDALKSKIQRSEDLPIKQNEEEDEVDDKDGLNADAAGAAGGAGATKPMKRKTVETTLIPPRDNPDDNTVASEGVAISSREPFATADNLLSSGPHGGDHAENIEPGAEELKTLQDELAALNRELSTAKHEDEKNDILAATSEVKSMINELSKTVPTQIIPPLAVIEEDSTTVVSAPQRVNNKKPDKNNRDHRSNSNSKRRNAPLSTAGSVDSATVAATAAASMDGTTEGVSREDIQRALAARRGGGGGEGGKPYGNKDTKLLRREVSPQRATSPQRASTSGLRPATIATSNNTKKRKGDSGQVVERHRSSNGGGGDRGDRGGASDHYDDGNDADVVSSMRGNTTSVVRALKELTQHRETVEQSLHELTKITQRGLMRLSDRISQMELAVTSPDGKRLSHSHSRSRKNLLLEDGPTGGGDEGIDFDLPDSDGNGDGTEGDGTSDRHGRSNNKGKGKGSLSRSASRERPLSGKGNNNKASAVSGIAQFKKDMQRQMKELREAEVISKFMSAHYGDGPVGQSTDTIGAGSAVNGGGGGLDASGRPIQLLQAPSSLPKFEPGVQVVYRDRPAHLVQQSQSSLPPPLHYDSSYDFQQRPLQSPLQQKTQELLTKSASYGNLNASAVQPLLSPEQQQQQAAQVAANNDPQQDVIKALADRITKMEQAAAAATAEASKLRDNGTNIDSGGDNLLLEMGPTGGDEGSADGRDDDIASEDDRRMRKRPLSGKKLRKALSKSASFEQQQQQPESPAGGRHGGNGGDGGGNGSGGDVQRQMSRSPSRNARAMDGPESQSRYRGDNRADRDRQYEPTARDEYGRPPQNNYTDNQGDRRRPQSPDRQHQQHSPQQQRMLRQRQSPEDNYEHIHSRGPQLPQQQQQQQQQQQYPEYYTEEDGDGEMEQYLYPQPREESHHGYENHNPVPPAGYRHQQQQQPSLSPPLLPLPQIKEDKRTAVNRQFCEVLDSGSLGDIAHLMKCTGPKPELLSVSTRNRLFESIATLLYQGKHTERCLIWVLAVVKGREKLLSTMVNHTKRDLVESLEKLSKQPTKEGQLASLLKSQINKHMLR